MCSGLYVNCCYSGPILIKLEFYRQFKKTQISNFMKIRPLAAELFQSNRRTDRHDETNSLLRNFTNERKNMVTIKAGWQTVIRDSIASDIRDTQVQGANCNQYPSCYSQVTSLP